MGHRTSMSCRYVPRRLLPDVGGLGWPGKSAVVTDFSASANSYGVTAPESDEGRAGADHDNLVILRQRRFQERLISRIMPPFPAYSRVLEGNFFQQGENGAAGSCRAGADGIRFRSLPFAWRKGVYEPALDGMSLELQRLGNRNTDKSAFVRVWPLLF